MFRKSKASQLLWAFIYTDYTNLRSQCSWKEYMVVHTYELLVSYIQPTSWVGVGASRIAYGNNFHIWFVFISSELIKNIAIHFGHHASNLSYGFQEKYRILTPKLAKNVQTFFSKPVKKFSFRDITIIFSLRHVFIRIVWRKKRIMIIEGFLRIIFGKVDPPKKKYVFFGGVNLFVGTLDGYRPACEKNFESQKTFFR